MWTQVICILQCTDSVLSSVRKSDSLWVESGIWREFVGKEFCFMNTSNNCWYSRESGFCGLIGLNRKMWKDFGFIWYHFSPKKKLQRDIISSKLQERRNFNLHFLWLLHINVKWKYFLFICLSHFCVLITQMEF